MTTTLKDIAKQLKTSVSTVSRALQNHPRISAEKTKKIQDLARELDYQPNSFAINLKKKTSKTLGVIVPELSLHFFSEILSGMDETAHRNGYQLLICQSGEKVEREKEQIQNLYKANVDGILVAVSKETSNFGNFDLLRKKGFPVVLFSRTHPNFPSVHSDDINGGFLATKHLIQQGCKTIAHIAGPWHLYATKDRQNGYLKALETYHLPINQSLIIHSDLEKESNIEAVHQLLNREQNFDAIFCFNDYVAYDIIQVLKEKQIITGKDVLIVGFGNQPISTQMEPKLTSVDQQPYQIGIKSIEMILNSINSKIETSIKQTEILETMLIVRNSTYH